MSRSVNAIRKADGGNHRNPFPHATRPGLGREKQDYRGNLACPVGSIVCRRLPAGVAPLKYHGETHYLSAIHACPFRPSRPAPQFWAGSSNAGGEGVGMDLGLLATTALRSPRP